jgi:hypothetical protein
MRRDAGRVHPVQHTCDLKCGAKFQPAFAHTWSKLYQHQYSMQYQVSLNAAAGGWVRWWGHRRAEHGAVRPARITFGSLQAPMASSSTPVLLCLALCLAALHVVQCAIPAPCSACEAVAAELQRKLEAERPRNHLDMRHRLDKHGKRYGKVIPWRWVVPSRSSWQWRLLKACCSKLCGTFVHVMMLVSGMHLLADTSTWHVCSGCVSCSASAHVQSGQQQMLSTELTTLQPLFPVPCRMSELRAVELLEDLCGDMDDYTLYSNTSDSSAEPEWVKFRGEGAVSERTWWVTALRCHGV